MKRLLASKKTDAHGLIKESSAGSKLRVLLVMRGKQIQEIKNCDVKYQVRSYDRGQVNVNPARRPSESSRRGTQ